MLYQCKLKLNKRQIMTTAYTLKLFCFASDKKGTREVPRKILEESKEALSFM